MVHREAAAWPRREVLAWLASGSAAAMLSACGGDGADGTTRSDSVRTAAVVPSISVDAVTLTAGSPVPTFRLYTFISGPAGTVDVDGVYAVRDGYDGVSFPIAREAKVTGKPADHSFRDPSVVRDPVTGTYWMTASGHFILEGADTANCDLYRSEAGDGINFTHVCTVPANVPGAVGMWAPDLLPFNGQGALEFVVTLIIATASGGRIGVPHLYRSTSSDHAVWEMAGVLTGPAIPVSIIDWTMIRLNDRWVGCAVDFTNRPRELMFLATAPDKLGPWTSLVPTPLFGEEQIEGPQFFLPANGKLGIYYDRFTGNGLQYRETSDFRSFTDPVQVKVPLVRYGDQSVFTPPKHGTVLHLT
jgi:hypothetical protein